MATLTTLPLALQSRILAHLCAESLYHEDLLHLAKLHGPEYYLPLRHPETRTSLDHLHKVNAPLPRELLSPALASPILAAAAFRLLKGSMPYLTDRNTHGQLSLWVKAFSAYLHAVGFTDVGEVSQESLPRDLRGRVREKICCDAVDLFREITTNHVRLEVLDLVHVPFHKSGEMQDTLVTGLYTTLESSHSTLKELALPVYTDSDPCSHALRTVTLPNLTVLSIEMKETRNWCDTTTEEQGRLGRQFLGMMQAIDGHADRLNGLNTLEELRLINLYEVPCMKVRESGCSAGLFRAIKTMRLSMNYSFLGTSVGGRWFVFVHLFMQLECLHWTVLPWLWGIGFGGSALEGLSRMRKLKEVHLCHHHWMSGALFGAESLKRFDVWFTSDVLDNIRVIMGKIRTLDTYSAFDSHGLWRIASKCPDLQYLSLYITRESVYELGRLIRKCKRLTGLEILIHENAFGRLGKNGWLELEKAIPRCHTNLCELAIQTHWEGRPKAVAMGVATDCVVGAVERIGGRLERVAFGGTVRFESVAQILRGYCRILDTCLEYSKSLSHLEVDIAPCRDLISSEEIQKFGPECAKLRSSAKALMLSRPRLAMIDLGTWHRCLRISGTEIEDK